MPCFILHAHCFFQKGIEKKAIIAVLLDFKNCLKKKWVGAIYQILEMQKIRKAKKYTPKIAPETTGKVNVFGSIEEISNLVSDTGCSFCVDFAHILAREKSYKFDVVKKVFSKEKDWHIHFSGIEYGEKGERHHKNTSEKEIKKLLENLPKNKEIIIINEAPNPIGDSVKALKIHKSS